MAIYGVPSTKVAYLTQYYGTINKSSAAAGTLNLSLDVNPNPDEELINFQVKHTLGIQSNGSNYMKHEFNPYNRFDGPCIIKLQAIASANDIESSAGFDLVLEDRA